ncbi:aspartate aminotransferase family protein [bacterium]|nr:MAG: aspartate aminotransferase family protein [bacterium]
MKYSGYLDLLKKSLVELDSWRNEYGKPIPEQDRFFLYDDVLSKLVSRLKGNYPFHHPSYAGQMLKPPAGIAWLAYAITSTINPNNHALDGGPPSSEMEKEAVADLAKMVGYDDFCLGHLTSAGTTANLEALWIIKQILPTGKKLAYSANAHYTHERISAVLGIDSIKVPVLSNGDYDWQWLVQHKSEIGAFVVTMGTTGMGLVEPLSKVIDFFEGDTCWIHVDAAYGGFYKLLESDLPSEADWAQVSLADSIVIDPHKHGLQPYGCGAVLFRNAEVGKYYKHDSPYTYFTSEELHLGEISLECSRAGASAAAFWATLQVYPLNKPGLGSVLTSCRNAALSFTAKIKGSALFSLVAEPELDIVIYYPAECKTTSEISAISKKIFDWGMKAKPDEGFHLSLYTLSSEIVSSENKNLKVDSNHTVVLRSVFMKPEHEAFVDELIQRLERAYHEAK